ncbi:DUF4249 domain-containing protein [Sediminicola luteus]|uniref:DUF4249 domain-containing protein n=1 Tax=Sediminicola luteus TaxID=319238 RepID=A0A2A4GA91_9FLAO|nr:DUF4249 domain-containing protein [Sediminicola luteus]PCE65869.1 hypothetical protein B7P33_00780 [Sediminicola luteus]
MKKIPIFSFVFLLPLCMVLLGCVEEFEPKTTFENENLLVVDALVTNQIKTQKINLWQTTNLGANQEPQPEIRAQIRVVENGSTTHAFHETSPGIYESDKEWGIRSQNSYRLHITRANGKTYVSEVVIAPSMSELETVEAVVASNAQGETGISILINSRSEAQNSHFYRFEYAESYKIIAPEWSPFEFDVINREKPNYEVGIKINQSNKRVCYGYDESSQILQFTTAHLTEDRIVDYEVRFIPQTNYIVSHRYTIEVSQYVQTPDSFSYFEQLKEQEAGQNLLSTVQPGFLQGNVRSEKDKNERVVGFFDVSTVSSKRIWVNYSDMFPNAPLPPYVINCIPNFSPRLIHPQLGTSPLIEALDEHLITYVSENEDYPLHDPRPYLVVKVPCGDCSVLGTDKKPDFWIE